MPGHGRAVNPFFFRITQIYPHIIPFFHRSVNINENGPYIAPAESADTSHTVHIDRHNQAGGGIGPIGLGEQTKNSAAGSFRSARTHYKPQPFIRGKHSRLIITGRMCDLGHLFTEKLLYYGICQTPFLCADR